MGDRVSVYVQVLESQAEQALEVLNRTQHADRYDSGDGTVEILLSEVNYADIGDETAELIELGIPHTWSHDAGGCYEAGSGYAIFDSKGEYHFLDFEDKEIHMNPNYILQLIEQGKTVDELKLEVLDYMQKYRVPELKPEMVEYGKRYRLNQAIIK